MQTMKDEYWKRVAKGGEGDPGNRKSWFESIIAYLYTMNVDEQLQNSQDFEEDLMEELFG